MAKKKGMSRRDFFRVSSLGSMGLALAGFGGASLGFLWPSLRGGFGSKINLGSVEVLKEQIAAEPSGLLYFPEARSYLIDYRATAGNEDVYDKVAAGGLLAIYQKCAHLGCRVPSCVTSQWLECPCHGSRYNKAGEYKFGPAPRGLDHFPLVVEENNVTVDTSTRILGPPRGTDTIGQSPAGPHCVG
ncbi:MAG TPA: Rieske 2Fe-2S domain-containing protein [Mycobacteriales bacterium]|nr:Rieske 2Fe-2S domain-containing protein [Mycobacteriales bacterium]